MNANQHEDTPRGAARCQHCPGRVGRGFCRVSGEALAVLRGISSPAQHNKHSLLYLQGQPARGVYLLCRGAAKLSAHDEAGRGVVLRLAQAGDVLGLGELFAQGSASADPELRFTASAELTAAAVVNFIPIDRFQRFLSEYPETMARCCEQLADECRRAYAGLRVLGQTRSVTERVASWLLRQGTPEATENRYSFGVSASREDIARMLCTSRESVCRTLARFQREGVLELRGHEWTVLDRAALRARSGE